MNFREMSRTTSQGGANPFVDLMVPDQGLQLPEPYRVWVDAQFANVDAACQQTPSFFQLRLFVLALQRTNNQLEGLAKFCKYLDSVDDVRIDFQLDNKLEKNSKQIAFDICLRMAERKQDDVFGLAAADDIVRWLSALLRLPVYGRGAVQEHTPIQHPSQLYQRPTPSLTPEGPSLVDMLEFLKITPQGSTRSYGSMLALLLDVNQEPGLRKDGSDAIQHYLQIDYQLKTIVNLLFSTPKTSRSRGKSGAEVLMGFFIDPRSINHQLPNVVAIKNTFGTTQEHQQPIQEVVRARKANLEFLERVPADGVFSYGTMLEKILDTNNTQEERIKCFNQLAYYTGYSSVLKEVLDGLFGNTHEGVTGLTVLERLVRFPDEINQDHPICKDIKRLFAEKQPKPDNTTVTATPTEDPVLTRAIDAALVVPDGSMVSPGTLLTLLTDPERTVSDKNRQVFTGMLAKMIGRSDELREAVGTLTGLKTDQKGVEKLMACLMLPTINVGGSKALPRSAVTETVGLRRLWAEHKGAIAFAELLPLLSGGFSGGGVHYITLAAEYLFGKHSRSAMVQRELEYMMTLPYGIGTALKYLKDRLMPERPLGGVAVADWNEFNAKLRDKCPDLKFLLDTPLWTIEGVSEWVNDADEDSVFAALATLEGGQKVSNGQYIARIFNPKIHYQSRYAAINSLFERMLRDVKLALMVAMVLDDKDQPTPEQLLVYLRSYLTSSHSGNQITIEGTTAKFLEYMRNK